MKHKIIDATLFLILFELAVSSLDLLHVLSPSITPLDFAKHVMHILIQQCLSCEGVEPNVKPTLENLGISEAVVEVPFLHNIAH